MATLFDVIAGYEEFEAELLATDRVLQHGLAGYFDQIERGVKAETRYEHMLRTAELVRMAGGTEKDIASARYHDIKHGNLSHLLDKVAYILELSQSPLESYHERADVKQDIPQTTVVKSKGMNADRLDYTLADAVRYGIADKALTDEIRRCAYIQDEHLFVNPKHADAVSQMSLNLDKFVYNNPKRQYIETVGARYIAQQIKEGRLSFDKMMRKEYSDWELAEEIAQSQEMQEALKSDAVWSESPAGMPRRCRVMVLDGVSDETLRKIEEWRQECSIPVILHALI